jgi:hypothetical protein
MARCTAPTRGHRTASGRESCPACRSRYGYGSYSSGYSSSYRSSSIGSSPRRSASSSRSRRVRWAPTNSTVWYTPAEITTLTPFREKFEKVENKPDIRDFFLCHAWDDRKGPAKELHDLLESNNASVWFSEKDVPLGSSLLREIDKGLANSKIGIVLVTPEFLLRLKGDGIADKELSALLATDQLIPVIHNTTYEDLREVSPLLASRSGLSTSEESMTKISEKLAELVTPSSLACA